MSGSALLADFLPEQVRNPTTVAAPATVGENGAFDWDQFVGGRIGAGSENLYAEALERMEREVLVRVLKHTDGNQLQAARILGDHPGQPPQQDPRPGDQHRPLGVVRRRAG